MSKARQSARQRHNWTRIDMREGGRIGFSGAKASSGAKAGSGAKASQPDGFDKNARTKELMKTENLPFNIASRIARQEQIRYREAQKNIERQGNNRDGRIGFFGGEGEGTTDEEQERENERRQEDIKRGIFGGIGRQGRIARRQQRRASGDWYLGKRLAESRANRQSRGQWYLGKRFGADPAKRQGIAPSNYGAYGNAQIMARQKARGEAGGQPIRRWLKDNLINKPWMPGGEQGPLRELGQSIGLDGERLRSRPNYDRVMGMLSYLNPLGQQGIIRGPLGGWRNRENTGGRINARMGFNPNKSIEDFEGGGVRGMVNTNQTQNKAKQTTQTNTNATTNNNNQSQAQTQSATTQNTQSQVTQSGQETQEGAGEFNQDANTATAPSGEQIKFWDGVSQPTRDMFVEGEQGDKNFAAALNQWNTNNAGTSGGGNTTDNSGGGTEATVVTPEPTPQEQLQEQASTDPKLENVDAVTTDATILTGDEDIQKISDPTNVTPADEVKATDLTAKTGTAQQGELTEAKDTVTYDAVKAKGVDKTEAQTGKVSKDVEAGQATFKEGTAAERDEAQEEAAKADPSVAKDYEISDDALVKKVDFREKVTVAETDPAEQQQRQVQLGMPAPDGEAAQIINKYGFGNSKKPPRIVTGEKAKQQAAAQLAADHDLDPEVANQIMEDVEGFDVEGQSQESLGAVAALPKEALVSTQIENLVAGMEDGKPPAWARPAVAAVEQMMAARGLSASTVGRDALFNSIIQSAMPIAQSNATALQQRAAQNLSNEQQALIQDREIAARFLEKNAEFKQQMELANLSNDQQMRLANLTSRNQNESENLSARQQTELANLNARLQTNLTSAKIAESMGVALLNADQQRAVQNAAMFANVDMNKFNATQQIELANSKFMQTMTMRDLDNRQQTALQNATLQAQVDMTNASERTKASVANAQNYLQMDITNVNNRQQAVITDQQLKQQRLLSDQAAENTARQFNAKSENQNNQFMVSMANQMEQFNKAQLNTMEQFNIGEQNRMAATEADQKLRADSFNAEQINRIRQFDAELDFRADSWNAQNAQAIQQSNIEWRRKCNTIDTAAQNAVNATNAQMQFGMTQQAQSALWQQLRDAAHFSHQDSQSSWDRKMNIVNAAIGNETLMTHRDFTGEQKKIWDVIDSIMDSLPPGSIAPMDNTDSGPPDDEA